MAYYKVLKETKGGTNQSTYATGNTLYASGSNTLSKLAIGSTNQVSKVRAGIPSWEYGNTVVVLTDGATVSLDASQGDVFTLDAGGSRTILAPTNAINGQRIVIRHFANGGARTLSLTTGSSGAFSFGTDITALTSTTSGLYDYIGFLYNGTTSRWNLVSYVKGF